LTREERNQYNYNLTHKTIDGVEYKQCTKKDHQEWFPMTEEYFYKTKETSDRFSSWCKKCSIEATSKRIANNKEEIYRKQRIYQKAKLKERNKLTLRWRHEHPQQHYESSSSWRRRNPEKCNEYSRNKRKHIISIKEWEACQKYFDYKCAYCGLPITEHWITHKGVTKLGGFHKDHNDENGANDLSNCIPACKSCNCHKWNFNFEDWYRKQEFFTEDRYNKIIKWLTEDYKLYIKDEKSNKSYKYKYINKFSNIVQ